MKDIERMLVSAHEDGEVESPWKKRLETRLAEDPVWAAEAALHRRVKAVLAAAPEPDWAPARERIREALAVHSALPPVRRTTHLTWISVAAALLVLAAGGGFWLGRQSAPNAAPDVAEVQVQVPKAMGLKLSGEGQLLMASTLQRSAR